MSMENAHTLKKELHTLRSCQLFTPSHLDFICYHIHWLIDGSLQ